MIDLAEIVTIAQEMGERPVGQMNAANGLAGRQRPDTGSNVPTPQFPLQRANGSQFKIEIEDQAHDRRLLLVHMEFALAEPIAEGHNPAHPQSLLLRRCDLVANALARDLALELGERQQHVEGQAAHTGRGVERLRHRDEGDAMRVECLHQLGEIRERARQPINLIDDDNVDPALANSVKQPLQRRPLHGAAGIATVVESLAHQTPALVHLTFNKGLGGLSLGVEGIELLFETRVGGDASVDCAANGRGHGLPPTRDDCRARRAARRLSARWHFVRPLVLAPRSRAKKRRPFHRTPVMARATAERLPYIRPSHSKPSATTVTR